MGFTRGEGVRFESSAPIIDHQLAKVSRTASKVEVVVSISIHIPCRQTRTILRQPIRQQWLQGKVIEWHLPVAHPAQRI